MKRLPLLWLGMITLSVAQDAPRPNLFRTVRPQISLTIRRDPNGSQADLINATSIDANYPPEQLQNQMLALGRSLNSEPRGLSVTRRSVSGDDARFTSIQATCAVDNLIDRQTGHFHLSEIVRAFSGAPAPHEVTGLSISFVGETPRKDTLLAFGDETDAVQIQGDYNPTFKSIEYRAKINQQDAAKIIIPEAKEQIPVKTPSTVRSGGIDWSMIVLIGIAAIAVGALVYSLLIRTTASKRS